MFVKILTSFGTSGGRTFLQGTLAEVPDDLAKRYLTSGHVQRVVTPVGAMVDIAKEHSLLIAPTANTTPEFIESLKEACKEMGAPNVLAKTPDTAKKPASEKAKK